MCHKNSLLSHYIELSKSMINLLNNVLEECFNPKLYTVIKVIDTLKRDLNFERIKLAKI